MAYLKVAGAGLVTALATALILATGLTSSIVDCYDGICDTPRWTDMWFASLMFGLVAGVAIAAWDWVRREAPRVADQFAGIVSIVLALFSVRLVMESVHLWRAGVFAAAPVAVAALPLLAAWVAALAIWPPLVTRRAILAVTRPVPLEHGT